MPPEQRTARLAVTVVFFASGASYGSFVARIPALKAKLEAGEAELGLVLLAGAVGAVLVLPPTGWLAARVGSRLVTRAALVAVAACLPLLAVAPTLPLFAAAFLVFGAVTSALDLAMNAHAVAVEERYARPIFSSFHASWSLGGSPERVREAVRLRSGPRRSRSSPPSRRSSRRSRPGRGAACCRAPPTRGPAAPPSAGRPRRCSGSPPSRSPACSPRAPRPIGAPSTCTRASVRARARPLQGSRPLRP